MAQQPMNLDRVDVVHVMTFHGFRQNGTATEIHLIRERQPYTYHYTWVVSNDGVMTGHGSGAAGRASAIAAFEKLVGTFLDGQKG